MGTGCLLSLPSLGGIYELLRSQPSTGAGSCEFIILTARRKLCGAMMDEARDCLRSMLSRRAAQWEHQRNLSGLLGTPHRLLPAAPSKHSLSTQPRLPSLQTQPSRTQR